MKVTSKIKLVLGVGVILFLSACTQTMSTSKVIIDKEYLNTRLKEAIVAEVYNKSSQFAGNCKVLSAQRQFHSCLLTQSNPSVRLEVGYYHNGKYVISVTATRVHWFPPREERISSGQLVGEIQKELEEWMRSLVPPEAIVKAERTYVGYEFIQEF